jgi:hypothetical protein
MFNTTHPLNNILSKIFVLKSVLVVVTLMSNMATSGEDTEMQSMDINEKDSMIEKSETDLKKEKTETDSKKEKTETDSKKEKTKTDFKTKILDDILFNGSVVLNR